MNWYCINTRPAKETQVETYLNDRLGVQTYSPRIIQEKIVRGMMTEVTAPLFPRYLFCRCDLNSQYNAMRQTPEFVDFVRAGGEPSVVSSAMITQLKNWAGEGVDILNFQPGDQIGVRVEITNSPTQVLPEAIVQSTNARERVELLLSILQDSTVAPTVISAATDALK